METLLPARLARRQEDGYLVQEFTNNRGSSASLQLASRLLVLTWVQQGPGGIGPSMRRRPQLSGFAAAGQLGRVGGSVPDTWADRSDRCGSGSDEVRPASTLAPGRRWWRCRTIRAAARARCLKNLVP